MLASGKQKMGEGCVLILDDPLLKQRYSDILRVPLGDTVNG
jgi:hypothetical protein